MERSLDDCGRCIEGRKFSKHAVVAVGLNVSDEYKLLIAEVSIRIYYRTVKKLFYLNRYVNRLYLPTAL